MVRTKLQAPPLRADTVARPRLLEALRAAVTGHRLTLVSAPAGYGKTTLLSAFAHAHPDLPVAWLSLDEDDDDPARFFAGLLVALRGIGPEFGGTTMALLADLPDAGAEPRRVAGVLVNDLVAGFEQSLALVVDDLHSIGTPAVYVALDYLLERLPPNVHLVVGTRHDPPLALARLRAHRHLAELRIADLRFTTDEAAGFFAGAPAGSLSPEQLSLLYERTEGWAAGMSLLAGALDRLPSGADRDALLARLAASDRYVFDYLAEEVLRREDPATRDFLLRTSILAELTATRTGAVTGRTDAGTVLEDLYRRNLFILALDAAETTFRYHDLFRDFLRRTLRREFPGEELRELHRRAASAEPESGRAIVHLLAIEAWDEAAVAVEHMSAEALDHGTFGTLRDWIDALPGDVRRRHPRLSFVQGVAAWDRWDIGRARDLLVEARDGFAATDDAAGMGEADVQLASCLIALGDHAGAQPLLGRAHGAPLPARARTQLLLNLAWGSLFAGDWQRANAALDDALNTVEAAGESRVVRMLAQQFQPDFAVLPGGPTRVDRLRRLVEASLGERPSLLRAYVATVVAWSHLWRGEWTQAPAAAEEALAINEQFGGAEQAGLDVIGLTAGLFLARWHALRGDFAAADDLIDRRIGTSLRHALDSSAMRAWQTAHIYPVARLRLLQGRTEEARALAARMPAPEPGEWTGAETLRSLLRGHLALAERRLPDARLAFREAMESQERRPFTTVNGLAALPLARVHLDEGHPDDAMAVLTPVLAEHEREGTPGAIMWEEPRLVIPPLRMAVALGIHPAFAKEILARLDPGSVSAGVVLPGRDEALTAREIEVLRLIAGGAGNAAIADALFISVHTVKIHVARILAKLGVETRGQAAARARELGIV